LLGAGAGSLLPELAVEYLRKGYVEAADSDSRLAICVLDKDLFERVRGLNFTN
jgi:hypothetical protein